MKAGVACLTIVVGLAIGASARADEAASEACRTLALMATRPGDPGFVAEMGSVYRATMRSDDRELKAAATEMQTTSHDILKFMPSFNRFANICLGRIPRPSRPVNDIMPLVPPPPPPPPPPPGPPKPPISAAEADQQLKGVLERDGAQGSKCTKKQYGTGWATVCE
jgi:hypothetical protein